MLCACAIARRQLFSSRLPAARLLSAAPSGPSRLLKELREQLTPVPDLPGITNTTLIDPQGWSSLSASEVELAFKMSLWMSLVDYGNLLAMLLGRPTTLREEGGGGGAAGPGVGAGAAPGAGAQLAAALAQAPTSEDIRAATLQAATRLSSLSRDEELRGRLAAMGSSALHLTRDCLDEFLAGYEVRSRRSAILFAQWPPPVPASSKRPWPASQLTRLQPPLRRAHTFTGGQEL